MQTYSVVEIRNSVFDASTIASMIRLHATSQFTLFKRRDDVGFLHKAGHSLAFYLLSVGIPFVCIKATGIFPFLQNSWMIDLFRQHFGEFRPQAESPFYRFDQNDTEPLAFLVAALLSSFADFDLFVTEPLISIEFSHDDWIRVRADEPSKLDLASNIFHELGCPRLSNG